MKNRYIILFLTFFSFAAYSQKFSGGILAGISGGQVDGDTQYGYKKFGVKAGGFVKTEISDKLDAKIEFYYTGKGAKKNTDPENNDYVYIRTHFDYVEMPFILSYNAKKKISIEAGVSVAYLMNASLEDEKGLIPEEMYNFKTFDSCMLLGVRYNLYEKLSIKLNFSYSLTSITTVTPLWFNNVMSITFLYDI